MFLYCISPLAYGIFRTGQSSRVLSEDKIPSKDEEFFDKANVSSENHLEDHHDKKISIAD